MCLDCTSLGRTGVRVTREHEQGVAMTVEKPDEQLAGIAKTNPGGRDKELRKCIKCLVLKPPVYYSHTAYKNPGVTCNCCNKVCQIRRCADCLELGQKDNNGTDQCGDENDAKLRNIDTKQPNQGQTD